MLFKQRHAPLKMNKQVASLEWIDLFKFKLDRTASLKTCLCTCVSWLSEWISQVDRSNSSSVDQIFDCKSFCEAMAAEVEICEKDDDELWIWSWKMAAQMIDLYWESALWTEEEMINYLRDEIDDVPMILREDYARHLFASAIAFIHGWAANQSGYRA